MRLLVNLRHLERHAAVLKGELSVEELAIETLDELIRVNKPLRYDFQAELVGDELLLRGALELELECDCVRCLKPTMHLIRLADWTCVLPLTGEEAVVREGDFVDLTPSVREDILLAFPQHPLCEPECPGLAPADPEKSNTRPGERPTAAPLAWTELDKLQF
ncbi:MAG TPA: YceD family protein [Verrucomicrobiae bacterium]